MVRFSPACPQPRSPRFKRMIRGIGEMSEDCLTLNIWAPAKVRSRRRNKVVDRASGKTGSASRLDRDHGPFRHDGRRV
jgi:hypothetical protein